MKLPFFFEPFIAKPDYTLSEETSRHCVQVLRMKENDLLNLTDGKGNLYQAKIINANKKSCEVKIEELLNANNKKQAAEISIAISVLKNSTRLEWFMEKATEIGVFEIIPLICEYTERENFRYERMNGIIISAMLQSQQTWLPALHQPKKITDFIQEDFNGLKLIAHCADVEKIFISNINKNRQNILILIGPEGDFSKYEIETALQYNYQAVSLGNTRLRSETAGIVATSLLCNLH